MRERALLQVEPESMRALAGALASSAAVFLAKSRFSPTTGLSLARARVASLTATAPITILAYSVLLPYPGRSMRCMGNGLSRRVEFSDGEMIDVQIDVNRARLRRHA